MLHVHITIRRAVLALVCAAWAGACGGPAGPPTRVVLITVDTLRRDGWEADAEGRSPMPLTVARVRRGQVFGRAYASSSSTQPTHVSLFTGLQPWEHGITRNGLRIDPAHELLSERLERAGFESHAVVGSFPVGRGFGFERGFATYDADFTRGLGDGTWNEESVGDDAFYSLGDDVTARALALLDTLEAPRQFLWVHYFDPHDPYGDSRPGRTLNVSALRLLARERGDDLPVALRKARQLYRADLEAMDVAIDALLARLEADAERWETHVVITSDHGESFGEDGSLGHGHRVSMPQVAVPLAILSPRIEPGERADVCGSIDVHATLLDLAGIEDESRGRSLLGPTPPGPGRAFGMRRSFDEPRLDTRTDGSAVPVNAPRFFAVVEDGLFVGRAEELVRLPAEEPVEDAELARLFGRFEAELAAHRPVEVDDARALEALRLLGYTR